MVTKVKDQHGYQYVVKEQAGYMMLVSATNVFVYDNATYLQLLADREILPMESNW